MALEFHEAFLHLNASLKSLVLPAPPAWKWPGSSGLSSETTNAADHHSVQPPPSFACTYRKPQTHLVSGSDDMLGWIAFAVGVVGWPVRSSELSIAFYLTPDLRIRCILVSRLHWHLAATSQYSSSTLESTSRYQWIRGEEVGRGGDTYSQLATSGSNAGASAIQHSHRTATRHQEPDVGRVEEACRSRQATGILRASLDLYLL